MKIKRIICLLLAFLMLSCCLVACDDGKGNEDENKDVDEWAELDFKGNKLTISVSVNNPNQVTFQNAGVYTKGPDNAATSEAVQKKVLARNKKVAGELDITLAYDTTDWAYSEISRFISSESVAAISASASSMFSLCKSSRSLPRPFKIIALGSISESVRQRARSGSMSLTCMPRSQSCLAR